MNAMNPTGRVPIHILPNMFMLGKQPQMLLTKMSLTNLIQCLREGGGSKVLSRTVATQWSRGRSDPKHASFLDFPSTLHWFSRDGCTQFLFLQLIFQFVPPPQTKKTNIIVLWDSQYSQECFFVHAECEEYSATYCRSHGTMFMKNPKTKQNTYLCKDIELACLHGKVRNPNKQVPAKGGVRQRVLYKQGLEGNGMQVAIPSTFSRLHAGEKE